MTARQHPTREQAMRHTSVVGAAVNLLLTLIKIGVGIIGQSAALVADGVHSLSDLATDVMVWLAAGYSNQPPDRDHPYGHGRIETAFTVALGAVLILTALGLLIDVGQRLLDPARLLKPAPIALIVAVVSILAKEALYRYTMHIAVRQQSSLLEANAWHHRSDAVSSIVVLVGVAGSLAGFPYLDAFAAVGVALMIAHVGWDLARKAVMELIDTGLEPERLRAIHQLVSDVDGVLEIPVLRTRRMAGQTLVDVHILVPSRLSVSEGHRIGTAVRDRLLASRHDIIQVTVHTDPEKEPDARRSSTLPLRGEVLDRLRECWSGQLAETAFGQVTLHYLGGRIDVDLILPLTPGADPAALARRLQHDARSCDWLGNVRVYLA